MKPANLLGLMNLFTQNHRGSAWEPSLETLAWGLSQGGVDGMRQGEGEGAGGPSGKQSQDWLWGKWEKEEAQMMPCLAVGNQNGWRNCLLGENGGWEDVPGKERCGGKGEEGVLDRWCWGHLRRYPERSWRWGVKLEGGW